MGIKKLADSFRPHTLSEISILVVDDRRDMREAMAMVLDFSGFKKIHEAADGQAALEVLGENHIDLIISDFDMPRVNGLQLLRLVREDKDLHDMPVVITSGTEGLEQRALATGADAFVTKGRDISEMIGIVTQLAEASLMNDAAAEPFSAQNDQSFDPKI